MRTDVLGELCPIGRLVARLSTGNAPAQRINWRRVALLGVASLAFLWGVGTFYVLITHFPYGIGVDYRLYQGAARGWLAGGDLYPAFQLTGQYDALESAFAGVSPVLYPPVALLLFVPSLLLPAALWWAIPLGITVWIVWSYRPSPLAWMTIGIAFAFRPTMDTIVTGNPGMWVPAFVALATRWPAASALVLFKPSLFLFALIGIRDRRWWLVVGGLALVSLALLPLDIEWVRSMLNATGSRSGMTYSLREVPMDLIPLVAWAGRHRELIEATRG
jgi:hypothetical protein